MKICEREQIGRAQREINNALGRVNLYLPYQKKLKFSEIFERPLGSPFQKLDAIAKSIRSTTPSLGFHVCNGVLTFSTNIKLGADG